ncbi:MAG: histidine phosphatase family protein, partial [Alphaproteobacteria bacterium]|nr:histidine phosphatase family protein [Alphaproteobacteria bacterium]
MTLFVLRHAKSDWDAGIARDFDRPINARGKAGARLMGEWLKREASLIDHIVSSPALRCAETLDLLWEGYGRILHPVWDKRAYLASVETLIDVIQDTPESAHSLLL